MNNITLHSSQYLYGYNFIAYHGLLPAHRIPTLLDIYLDHIFLRVNYKQQHWFNYVNHKSVLLALNYRYDYAKTILSLLNTIKSIANLHTPKQKYLNLLNLYTSPEASVNEIDCFISRMGHTLIEKKVEQSKPPNFWPYLIINIVLFAMYDTNKQKIENVIFSLRRNCAIGWDGISTKFLKRYKEILVPPIYM